VFASLRTLSSFAKFLVRINVNKLFIVSDRVTVRNRVRFRVSIRIYNISIKCCRAANVVIIHITTKGSCLPWEGLPCLL